MAQNNAVLAKGESPMTDLQFTAYIEIRNKYEALLQEVVALRMGSAQVKAEDAEGTEAKEIVSDYQFQRYEQLRDKCEALSAELASMRKENTKLKLQVEMLKSSFRISKY